jgi:chromosome segregation ATPase
MIEETIKKIGKKITESKNPDEVKDKNIKDLVHLLETLKNEVAELSKTHEEHAESIAGFAKVSAHEATRREQNPELLKLSVKGLASSVEGIESSHPKLVDIVNRISVMLSNMGI